MSDVRFAPRDFCSPSYEFGTSAAVKWIPLVPTGNVVEDRVLAARLDASIIQHEVSGQVRTRLSDLRSSVAAVAHACGMKPERLRRVLRGEVPMRLDDLTLLDHVLGALEVPGGASLREQVRTRSARNGDV